MPDEARDGRNVALNYHSELLMRSIVQRNHSILLTCMPTTHLNLTKLNVYFQVYPQNLDIGQKVLDEVAS